MLIARMLRAARPSAAVVLELGESTFAATGIARGATAPTPIPTPSMGILRATAVPSSRPPAGSP